MGVVPSLDDLETGVLLVTPALAVDYASAQWTRWLGKPIETGTPVAELARVETSNEEGTLADLFANHDASYSRFGLLISGPDGADRRLECSARRTSGGWLLEARANLGQDGIESGAIAARLATATDMAEVLNALCEIAAKQCSGTGAAVMRVIRREGEVVAASGSLASARGRQFALEGSLLSEAISGKDVVREERFASSGRPLMRAVPELAVGPVMAAPLRAHGEALGVLAVSRDNGGLPFKAREVERLRFVADHAALAVHKSLLLYQAQSADRAKGRFLATMSHELRTPLTALAGYNELLADQVIGPLSESQLDILERMRSVTTHLSSMIEEILSFTSLEEGREIVRPTEFLIADLAHSAMIVVEPAADAKKLKTSVVLPRESIRITSDIEKSRQILVNLLGNAVKFTDSGAVTLSVSVRGASVLLQVKDTGIGIPQDELSRLFRPFAQVDTGLTRRHGGTGLGLYISRRLATLLRGHIEVESNPGKGTTFTVVLPLHWE